MVQKKLWSIQEEVNHIIMGKQEIVKKVLAAMLANGHILMEDIPGVGKTTLATTFAKTMSMDYHRVQFTPDVLPSDLLGFSLPDKNTGNFMFHPGSVFCNLFLADEINRTSPKTQSALLEVMEERQASVEGMTRKLPIPFLVIATENPTGSSGTQMLPESQLDRFMICLSMGYPAHVDAVELLKGEVWKKLDTVKPVLTKEEFIQMQQETAKVFVHDAIYEYIISLVEATRQSAFLAQGASPRASIALLQMGRALAYLEGRDFVTAQDIQTIFPDVVGHRVKVSSRAKAEGKKEREVLREVLLQVKSPRC